MLPVAAGTDWRAGAWARGKGQGADADADGCCAVQPTSFPSARGRAIHSAVETADGEQRRQTVSMSDSLPRQATQAGAGCAQSRIPRAGSVIEDVGIGCGILASGVKQSTGRRPSPSGCPRATPLLPPVLPSRPLRLTGYLGSSCRELSSPSPGLRGEGPASEKPSARTCPYMPATAWAADWSPGLLGSRSIAPGDTDACQSHPPGWASREGDGDMDEDGVCKRQAPWQRLPLPPQRPADPGFSSSGSSRCPDLLPRRFSCNSSLGRAGPPGTGRELNQTLAVVESCAR